MELTGIYSGVLPRSGERLERIGAPAEEAAKADWDSVAADGTALRGYGNVMWYPVAGAPAFLGDGAKLFDAVGRAKLRQQATMMRLRVTVEYTGEAPDAAYFCGRRELFTAVSDNSDLPVAAGRGVATAEFRAQALGFRVPSLFFDGQGCDDDRWGADSGGDGPDWRAGEVRGGCGEGAAVADGLAGDKSNAAAGCA